MPSTEYFGYLVTNVGPLTSTFTADPSCATARENLVVEDADIPRHYWREQCHFPSLQSSCLPSASKFDDLYSSYVGGDLGHQGWAAYYSPASICPSGWETVGVAALSSGAESPSASGIFTTPRVATADSFGDSYPRPPAWQEIYVGALDEGETVVWCCPSDHSVDDRGICTSTVGPLDDEDFGHFTTVCNYGVNDPGVVTVTSYDGKTWTPPLLSFSNDETAYTTFKETLEPSATNADYSVIHSRNVMALIHSDGDSNDGNGDGGNDDNDDDDNSDDDDDAAPSARTLSLLPFAAVGLGLLAGMGVLMPW